MQGQESKSIIEIKPSVRRVIPVGRKPIISQPSATSQFPSISKRQSLVPPLGRSAIQKEPVEEVITESTKEKLFVPTLSEPTEPRAKIGTRKVLVSSLSEQTISGPTPKVVEEGPPILISEEKPKIIPAASTRRRTVLEQPRERTDISVASLVERTEVLPERRRSVPSAIEESRTKPTAIANIEATKVTTLPVRITRKPRQSPSKKEETASTTTREQQSVPQTREREEIKKRIPQSLPQPQSELEKNVDDITRIFSSNIIPNVKEGQNYNERDLSHYYGKDTAESISNIIRAIFPENNLIIDINPSIGLVDLEMRWSTNISVVAPKPQQLIYFENNRKLYSRKINVFNTIDNLKQSLKATITVPKILLLLPDDSEINDQITITVNNIPEPQVKTVEQWILDPLLMANMFITRVPEKYEFSQTDRTAILEKYPAIYSVPAGSKKYIVGYDVKYRVATRRERTEEEVKFELYSIPYKQIKEFIKREILPNAGVTKEETMDKLVNEPNDKTWKAAFTHPSFDPTSDKNYEHLETIGDNMMRASFVTLILKMNPKLEKDEISFLKEYYLSTVPLSVIAIKLSLEKYLKIVDPSKISVKVKEDLVEAVCGALYITGETRAPGYGFILVNNYVAYMFNNGKDINLSKADDNPATQLKNLYTDHLRLGAIEVTQTVDPTTGLKTFSIKTPEGLKEFVDVQRYTIPENLAVTTGTTKANINSVLFPAALRTLESIGITREFAEDIAKGRRSSDKDIENKLQEAKLQAATAGFGDMIIRELHGGTSYIQLIGIRLGEKQKMRVLATVSTRKITKELKIGLIDAYIKHIKETNQKIPTQQ